MRISRERLIRWWVNWAAPLMLAAFVVISLLLAFRRHAAFQTNIYDLGSYAQVIWNFSQGHGLTNSLGSTNYLTNHFSPLLAALAPLFWVWPDARVLMVVQALALASAIVPGYLILRKRYPALAPFFVLAFVFSPLLHQTMYQEFHGVMLAPPLLAWAFYALYTRRTRMMIVALALTLLVREDMGLYVAAFGLFLLLFRPGQRLLGLGIIAVGGLSVVLLIVWVMPSFGEAYHHFFAFSSLGNSVPEIATNVVRDPTRLLASIFAASKLKAFVTLMAPLALLPLLSITYLPIWLPVVLVYLASSQGSSGLLDSWRIAPFVPLLWGAIAVLLVRLRPRWAVAGVTALLATSLIGFMTLSPYPGGGKFDRTQYQLTEHTQIGEQIVASLPSDVPLAAQSGLGAHLTIRPWIRLFPWYDRSKFPEIVVLDEKATNPFPLKADELKSALLTMQMDPSYDTAREQDGYYVFELASDQHPFTQAVSMTWSSLLRLNGYELAQSTHNGAFEPLTDGVDSESRLRAILHWTATGPMPNHLAISVRLLAPDGRVVAQEDSWPARGALPTPLWEVGRSIRDTHYLDLPGSGLPEQLTLSVIVYAADTLEPIEPAEGHVLTTLHVDDQAK